MESIEVDDISPAFGGRHRISFIVGLDTKEPLLASCRLKRGNSRKNFLPANGDILYLHSVHRLCRWICHSSGRASVEDVLSAEFAFCKLAGESAFQFLHRLL